MTRAPIPTMSVIEGGVGHRDTAGAWAAWARGQVDRWEPVPAGHDLLGELVPWWTDAARAAGVPVDDVSWAAGRDLRLGRDAEGAPRVLETTDGQLVATASSRFDEPLPVVASARGAVGWEVGCCDADGVLTAWHLVVRIDDRAVVWSCGTGHGELSAVEHGRGDGVVLAVWRGPATPRDPGPSRRRSVDALVRLVGPNAEVVAGPRPTIGLCERRLDELRETPPTTGGTEPDDAPSSGLPYDDEGEPLFAPWLAAVRAARRDATRTLRPVAHGLVEIWTDASQPEPLSDPGVVVIRLTEYGWEPTWFAQQDTTLDDLVRRRWRRKPTVEYDGNALVAVPWDADLGPDGEPWYRLVDVGKQGPSDFETAEEERAFDAEHAAADALLEDLVGEVNRELERRGTGQVVVMVDDEGHPTGEIDRWWPPEVRRTLRGRLT